MFNKIRISRKVDRIFDLAEKSGMVQANVPFYFAEVRFELLFFYFFLLDIREYNDLGEIERKRILDEFLERVSKEFYDEDALKKISILHNPRIDIYYRIYKESNSVGDFLMIASEFIEALAIFFQKKDHPFNGNIATVFNQISKDSSESLIEPIAKSIFLHSEFLI